MNTDLRVDKTGAILDVPTVYFAGIGAGPAKLEDDHGQVLSGMDEGEGRAKHACSKVATTRGTGDDGLWCDREQSLRVVHGRDLTKWLKDKRPLTTRRGSWLRRHGVRRPRR